MTASSGGSSTGLSFKPLRPAIGAEVAGLDLSRAVGEADFQALGRALLDDKILLFRGQALDEAGHIAFSRRFGALEHFPERNKTPPKYPEIYRVQNIDEYDRIRDVDDEAAQLLWLTQHWHIDSSFRATPSRASLIYAVEIPAEGGDTCFTNLAAAYDALPAARKAWLATLRVVHDYAHTRALAPSMPPMSAEEAAGVPPVEHPLVREHPVSGEKSLYIGVHAARIADMAEAESRALLDELRDWSTAPEFVYRHAWTPGDLLVWDNRCTMHRVMPYDAARDRRIMRRTTVAGEDRAA